MEGCVFMKALPQDTVRKICAGQVIVDISSAVKELLENALDAGALSIDLKLDGGGLQSIQVRDNGCGISDFTNIGLRYHTSKLVDFDDISTVSSYGFRGEALNSLCSLGEVSVVSRTERDAVGTKIELNSEGVITSQTPAPQPVGTCVTVKNLFKKLPVRYKVQKENIKNEAKKIHHIVTTYTLIHPAVRFNLVNNPRPALRKLPVPDMSASIACMFGASLLTSLTKVHHISDDCTIEGFLPKQGAADQGVARSVNDRLFTYVNRRPVSIPSLVKLVMSRWRQSLDSKRYPFICLSLTVPADVYDVNVTPMKDTLMFHNEQTLVMNLEYVLDQIYPRTVNPADSNREPSDRGDQDGGMDWETSADVTATQGPGAAIHFITSPIISSDDSNSGSATNKPVSPPAKTAGDMPLMPTVDAMVVEEDSNASTATEGLGKSVTTDMEKEANDKLNQDESVESDGSETDMTPAAALITDKADKTPLISGRSTVLQQPSSQTVTTSVAAAVPSNQRSLLQMFTLTPSSSHSHSQSQSTSTPVLFSSPSQPGHQPSAEKDISNSVVSTVTSPPSVIPPSSTSDPSSTPTVAAFPKSVTGPRASAGTKGAVIGAKRRVSDLDPLVSGVSKKHPVSESVVKVEVSDDDDDEEEEEETDAKLLKIARLHAETVPDILLPFSLSSLRREVYINEPFAQMLCFTELEKPLVPSAGSALNPTQILAHELSRARIVGVLEKHAVCMLSLGRRLFSFNPYRAEELLCYGRLCASYEIPRHKLAVPIAVALSEFHQRNAEGVLRSGCSGGLRERCFAMNGFDISMNDADRSILITALSDSIPGFGVADLQELVHLVSTDTNSNTIVPRPTAVKRYLATEATRVTSSCILDLDPVELEKTLMQLSKLGKGVPLQCNHGKPIFHDLALLPS